MSEKNNIVVEEEGLPEVPSLMAAGIFGETDAKSMADHDIRVIRYREQYGFHEVVTCPYCCNCIVFRKFTTSGEAYTAGMYCFNGEITVSEHGTCSNARARRHGRKRVLYDITNAPPGFEQGLAPVTMHQIFNKREKFKAIREESRGYRGGSSGYQRTDDEGEKGTGQIPRRLGN